MNGVQARVYLARFIDWTLKIMPHYPYFILADCNYLDTDFGKMASEEAGLIPQWKAVSSRTKTLTFLKPNASDN